MVPIELSINQAIQLPLMIFNSVELESIEIDTILSVPFCPYHFVRNILPNTILSGHPQKRSRHGTDTVPEFHAEAPQATVSEGLAQGPYVAARAGVEPTTLRLRVER